MAIGPERDEGHKVPANPRLWAMVIAMARSKFAKYPSPAASHWVHSEYERKGGTFVDGNKLNATKKLYSKQIADAKKKTAHNKSQDDK